MKVYLITSQCEEGVFVHAAEVDQKRAERLYEIFHEDNSEVYLEEYDTEEYDDYISGKIPYLVEFKQIRKPRVHLTYKDGVFPRVEENGRGIRVYVHAASKDEAYQKAVVIHRDYVTEEMIK